MDGRRLAGGILLAGERCREKRVRPTHSSRETREGTMTKAILTLLICVMAVAAILEVKLAVNQHEMLAQEDSDGPG